MLANYRTILVTTDLTPNSEHAFKHAVLLARKSAAKVVLLHVVPEIDSSFRSYVSSIMGEGKLEEFESQHQVDAQEALKRELEHFTRTELADSPDDLNNIQGVEVVHGHAVPQILAVADRIEADVIVMGTHGKGVIEHTFLGSVAEKVLRKSRRPVFVIPIPE